MRNRAATATVIAVVAVVTSIVPAQGHGGHGSCRGYGQTVQEFAQSERPFGQLVSGAATGGFNHLLVEETHAMPEICVQR